jgi:hypothetical protein
MDSQHHWNSIKKTKAPRIIDIGDADSRLVDITKGTFEERINDMIQQKKQLASLTAASGENWIGNLNNKELNELFRLTI